MNRLKCQSRIKSVLKKCSAGPTMERKYKRKPYKIWISFYVLYTFFCYSFWLNQNSDKTWNPWIINSFFLFSFARSPLSIVVHISLDSVRFGNYHYIIIFSFRLTSVTVLVRDKKWSKIKLHNRCCLLYTLVEVYFFCSQLIHYYRVTYSIGIQWAALAAALSQLICILQLLFRYRQSIW